MRRHGEAAKEQEFGKKEDIASQGKENPTVYRSYAHSRVKQEELRVRVHRERFVAGAALDALSCKLSIVFIVCDKHPCLSVS